MRDTYTGYDRHYERLGNDMGAEHATNVVPEVIPLQASWLPKRKDVDILDVGAGCGNYLLQMWAAGYRRLTGVERAESMASAARQRLPETITFVNADALDYLREVERAFDLITMFDVIEHFTVEDSITLLKQCHRALRNSGSIVIRTPNMANLLASYSRYMDITHLQGFTEWSLIQLVELAGFSRHELTTPQAFSVQRWLRAASVRHPLAGAEVERHANELVHRVLFRLRGQRPGPTVLSYNLTVQAWK